MFKNLLRELLIVKFDRECYRCGDTIADDEEFHIDHIEPWEHSENPLKLYLDASNIAFSHPACNQAFSAFNARRLSSKDRALDRTRYHRRKKFISAFLEKDSESE